MTPFSNYLNVAICQIKFNSSFAWSNKEEPQIIGCYEEYIWEQVKEGFRNAISSEPRADLIVFPELTIPNSYTKYVKTLSDKYKLLVISGVDYDINRNLKTAKNNCDVWIPNIWPANGEYSPFSWKGSVGKCYPAPMEKQLLKNIDYTFEEESHIWIFNNEKFGNFGIAICYDFMDVERYYIYKGRIQHLFVVAFNKDVQHFISLCESIARTVYCNVIICNNGSYGGSISYSPLKERWERILCKHEGKNSIFYQTIRLPVSELIEAQRKHNHKVSKFKPPPPNYELLNIN